MSLRSALHLSGQDVVLTHHLVGDAARATETEPSRESVLHLRETFPIKARVAKRKAKRREGQHSPRTSGLAGAPGPCGPAKEQQDSALVGYSLKTASECSGKIVELK